MAFIFAKAGAALAIVERTAAVPGFEGRDTEEVFDRLPRPSGDYTFSATWFAIAQTKITTERGQGALSLGRP